MRELIYGVEGKAANLKTFAIDEPGYGGACHRYYITTAETPPPIGSGMSSADLEKAKAMLKAVHDIRFQNGPINKDGNGVNGIQN